MHGIMVPMWQTQSQFPDLKRLSRWVYYQIITCDETRKLSKQDHKTKHTNNHNHWADIRKARRVVRHFVRKTIAGHSEDKALQEIKSTVNNNQTHNNAVKIHNKNAKQMSLDATSLNWLIEQGLTSHQTHYRSYRGRVFMGQMTKSTVSKQLVFQIRLESHQNHSTMLQ